MSVVMPKTLDLLFQIAVVRKQVVHDRGTSPAGSCHQSRVWLIVCVRTRSMHRDLIEIYRDLIEIGRGIISTNHITGNWLGSNWNTARCNYSQWHPEKLFAIQLSTSRGLSGLDWLKWNRDPFQLDRDQWVEFWQKQPIIMVRGDMSRDWALSYSCNTTL